MLCQPTSDSRKDRSIRQDDDDELELLLLEDELHDEDDREQLKLIEKLSLTDELLKLHDDEL